MDNNVQSIPEEKVVKPSSKGLYLIIVLLVVVIVVLLGIFIYLFLSPNKSEAPTSTTKKIVSVSHKTSANLNSYQGWKTYTNPTIGASFKYPSSWSIRVNTSQTNTSIPWITHHTSYTIRLISNNGNAISFREYINGGEGLTLASLIQPITVSGKNYDLFYSSYSDYPYLRQATNIPASCLFTTLPPCKAIVYGVYLDNISTVVTANGNSFGGTILTLQGGKILAEVSLTLATPINTSTVNTNQYVKIFKQFLSTVKF